MFTDNTHVFKQYIIPLTDHIFRVIMYGDVHMFVLTHCRIIFENQNMENLNLQAAFITSKYVICFYYNSNRKCLSVYCDSRCKRLKSQFLTFYDKMVASQKGKVLVFLFN